jgi:hypothetical protein
MAVIFNAAVIWWFNQSNGTEGVEVRKEQTIREERIIKEEPQRKEK